MSGKRKIGKMFLVVLLLCPSVNRILDAMLVLHQVYYETDTELYENGNVLFDEEVDNADDTCCNGDNEERWKEDPFYDMIADNVVGDSRINDIGVDNTIVSSDNADKDMSGNNSLIQNSDTNGNISDINGMDTDNASTNDNATNNNAISSTDSNNTDSVGNNTLDNSAITKIFTNEQLRDYNYLYNNFYTVDSTTTLSEKLLDGTKLLEKDLTINKNPEVPQILILHTHSQEFFADSDVNNIDTGIVGVGDYLTKLLTEKGYNVIHDRSIYDYVDGVLDRNNAYTLASDGAEKILNDNPTVEIVIDLHRDGIADESKHIVSEARGKNVAPVMFFNGISYTNKLGNIGYLYNPYIEDNLATSLQLKLKAEEYYPNVFRKIYIKGYRYVLHLKPRSMLIEAGFQTNTIQEVCNSMELLADILDMVFAG